jgi:hypothetical protein
MTRNFALAINWLPVAAVAFTLAWLIGLAIPVPMVDVNASPAALSGSETELALRSLFVHGFAAVALLVVGWGLSRPLAIALVVSAAGYGLLVPSLAAAAFVSLPLLLVWMTGSGLSR